MKQFKEGESENDAGLMDHSFITVPIKNHERIIDPFMGSCGQVRFSKDTNSMEIYNSTDRETKKRIYETLIEMSEEEIIKQLEELRKNGAGRLSLSGSEKIISYNEKIFVTFDSKTNILSTKINFDSDLPSYEPYKKSAVYKLETKVEENGKFDFSEGNFLSYYAGAWGWSHHVDEQEPLIIATKEAETAWNLIETIFKYNKIRKNLHKLGIRRMKIDLNRLGLNYDFSAKNSSITKKVINDGFSDKIISLRNTTNQSVEDFLERARAHEITWRTFLREAQYSKASFNKISSENEFGYIYSKDEHEKLLLDLIESYKKNSNMLIDNLIESMKIEAGIIKGSERSAYRKRNSSGNIFQKDNNLLGIAISLRKIKNEPHAYRFKADETLFFQNFDIANDPIEKLENGLNESDLLIASKNRLFKSLLLGASRRKVLFAKKYHPGLRNILNQTVD
jgi:hypothetical protein